MDSILLTKILILIISLMIIGCYMLVMISLIKLKNDSKDMLLEMKKDLYLYENKIIDECEKLKEEIHYSIHDRE